MYQLGQMFTATELLRNYQKIARLLVTQPQPILITHKGGERFIFVNAEIFDELVRAKLRADGAGDGIPSLRDQIFESIY